MATPLKINNVGGTEIKQLTTAEENYVAYQIGLHLAASSAGDVGSISTNAAHTSIGSYTNTFYNEPVGTHPSTSISSGSTTTTLYLNQGTAAETDSDVLSPIMWVDSGGQTGFKEMPDADLNEAVDRYLSTIFTNDYPGVFKLGTSSPGPDYSVWLSSAFTDTRTDGTSVAYNIYRRDTYSAPTEIPPMYVRDNAGFDGIQAMTDRQIKYSFGQRAKTRIGASKIGTYQIRTATAGAPTDPGTWVSAGSATDTIQTTADQSFTSTFVGQYDINYTRRYTGNYQNTYTGAYSKTYTGTYTSNYQRNYTGNYLKSYTFRYTGTYDSLYERAFNRPYTFRYTGTYDSLYQRGFDRPYTFRYTGGPYTSNYTNNFARAFVGTYAGTYTSVYARNFVGPNYTGTYTRTYVGNYDRPFASGNFGANYTGPAYSRNINYVGNYTGTRIYTSTTVVNYLRNYAAGYTRNYIGNYTGTRQSTFASIFDNIYISAEIQATNENVFARIPIYYARLYTSQLFKNLSGGSILGAYATGPYTGVGPKASKYASPTAYFYTGPNSTIFANNLGLTTQQFQTTYTVARNRITLLQYVRRAPPVAPFFAGSGQPGDLNYQVIYSTELAYGNFYSSSGYLRATVAANYTGTVTGYFIRYRNLYYQAAFTGIYENIYTGNYSRLTNFQGGYTRIIAFLGGYTRNYLGNYTGTYSRNFNLAYQGTVFNPLYTGQYTKTFDRPYDINYTRNYTVTYINNFQAPYDTSYTSTYTGDYANFFESTFDTSYTRAYTGGYANFFESTFDTPYDTDYAGNYANVYTNNFESLFTTLYSTAFNINYESITDVQYENIYETNYVGNFEGLTIQSGSETDETYTLYVRIG